MAVAAETADTVLVDIGAPAAAAGGATVTEAPVEEMPTAAQQSKSAADAAKRKVRDLAKQKTVGSVVGTLNILDGKEAKGNDVTKKMGCQSLGKSSQGDTVDALASLAEARGWRMGPRPRNKYLHLFQSCVGRAQHTGRGGAG